MYNCDKYLSLQLNQNNNEDMENLKYSCPPLIVLFSRRLIPLLNNNPLDELNWTLPAAAFENNAVSALDYAVRYGEFLA